MTAPLNLQYSIIIPVKSVNDYIRETIFHIQKFENNAWDVFILPNDADKDEWEDTRIKIIPTGRISPARKRDIGAEMSGADILVFLDDDSYPEHNLLEIADSYFTNENIFAIGGPGITPPKDSFFQKVSGAVFLSKFSGGFPERYVSVGNSKPVDDWPSVNLMVRRMAFLEVGGFDNDFWPGEDTHLCLKLIQHTKQLIQYVPEMIVWHHRRPGLIRHLKQTGAYARHRGFFARVFPENSRKLIFFIPSLFTGFCVTSIISLIWLPFLNPLITMGWLVYFGAMVKVWLDINKHETATVATMSLFYVLLTHFWYGIEFLIGFSKANLKSKLR